MVSADKSYQLLAYHYIANQLKKLTRQIDGARQAKDIEFIHQARVASRRIRAAFRVFEDCFDAKRLKKWRKEIKKLTKGLGDARDADVQIDYLNKVISELDEKEATLHPGIERLLLRTVQHRQKLQPKVVKTIDKLESKDVLADIHSALEKITFCMRNENPGVKSEYVFKATEEHICGRLQEMLACQDCLKDPSDKTGHHKMRIAAKRLRYTMEICQEPYNSKLDDMIKTVKKLQTLLGDIHDCDVWVDHIDDFMKAELVRTKKYFGYDKPYFLLLPGLEYLQQQRRQKRGQLFDELVAYWKKLCDKKIWDKLTSTLKEPLTNVVIVKPAIVEIRKSTSNEAKAQKNSADRGCSCEPAGVESGSK